MIDLRSDTVTRPSPAMRDAMAAAEVGDDVYGEDPTVNRLQAYAADLLGKEAALFVPSGTMANLLAFLTQTRPGDSIILSAQAHPFHYENANIAMIGGLLPRLIPDSLGKIAPEQLKKEILQTDDPHVSPTTLASIENTSNRGGGVYYELETIEELGRICAAHNMAFHCDGARIFNAAVATNVEPRYMTSSCTTVSFCLSKGLGAPVGSILTGDTETIHSAIRFRKMLGGGMRQAGILAAAGLYALEHHRDDLRDDHRRTSTFRRELEAAGVKFLLPSPTNILFLAARNAEEKAGMLKERGVLVIPVAEHCIRVVFHRDIDDTALGDAIDISKEVLGRS